MAWEDRTPEQQPAPEGQFQDGNYVGEYIQHICDASAVKGTPRIQIWFRVQGAEVPVDCWMTEATLDGITGDQLAAVGWNGEYGPKCEFDPPGPTALYLRHETYKDKARPRWNISTASKASDATMSSTQRACQLWKQRQGKPAPVPATAPKPPARPSVPARPAPAPTASKPLASDLGEAWDVWAKAGRDGDNAQFYEAIDDVAAKTSKTEAEFSSVEWSMVADKGRPGTPFD